MKRMYRSDRDRQRYLAAYEAAMGLWPIPYEERSAETSHGRTHVIVAGPEDAPPLVLFHGMGASSTMWYPNVAELAKRFRLYAVDSLGDFGRSEPMRPLKTKQDCVEWIKELFDALRLGSPFIAGHSMGGWLAAEFAAAYPERCQSLVLLAPVATLARVRIKFFIKMYPALLLRSRGRIAGLLQWCHAPGNEPHPIMKEQFIRGFQGGIFWLRAVPAVLGAAERARLPRTMVIVGEEEVIYDGGEVIRAASSSGIAAALIPNASHCLTSEQPERVNAAIIRFLAPVLIPNPLP
ncbi:alpha/beta hydrolase [Cohnella lubricantis]|uniref:Alpha/beta hydrolase n=1 Tax=Cohnella lubricantis TaxID=2163172 RepID=A0A841TE60_9BACL|nr:alpha/beta hydrolase [Cohnella lubricantis]MBB6679713.1 alpha/beta hydrolase [Cohnella lubricantis]MBP2119365.1 pimeloyl-ACP methyl ester carboxylesterase [Cohnella lubricantis]